MNQIIEHMESLNISSTILSEGVYEIVLINYQKLMVFKNGIIYIIKNNGNLKIIKNTSIMNGYNAINCKGKMILRHRIISYAFLGLIIEDVKQIIDHIDGNKLNNKLKNLRVVTQQQNLFNNHTAKGYTWSKRNNKYEAQICLNGKKHFFGYFTTEEEARQAYLNAKLIFHII